MFLRGYASSQIENPQAFLSQPISGEICREDFGRASRSLEIGTRCAPVAPVADETSDELWAIGITRICLRLVQYVVICHLIFGVIYIYIYHSSIPERPGFHGLGA